MHDPSISSLVQSLNVIFRSEQLRKGRYTYKEVQQLKEAAENYQSHPSKNNFIHLRSAVKNAFNYVQKWHVDLNILKEALEQLSTAHGVSFDWQYMHVSVKTALRFDSNNSAFTQLHDLTYWLTLKCGRAYNKLGSEEQTRLLVKYSDYPGFSKLLIAHLNKNPSFIFDLSMTSADNFRRIVQTRLVLFLTDVQLANALVTFIPDFVQRRRDPYEQVTLLIEHLNEILSNGRSIPSLLRNAEAKEILDTNIFIQLYEYSQDNNLEEIFSDDLLALQTSIEMKPALQ
jgi:hypothetical protein